MAVKSIVFNTDMTKLILDGLKTSTRRIIKPQPLVTPNHIEWRGYEANQFEGQFAGFDNMLLARLIVDGKTPYKPGDVLYVRETWNGVRTGNPKLGYHTTYWYKADDKYENPDDKWRPSTQMPKEAARLFLRVTDLKVERLQDISVEGILAEGINVELPAICKQEMDPNYPSEEQRRQYLEMSPEQQDAFVQNRARHTYMGWCKYADDLMAKMKRVWDNNLKPVEIDQFKWDANPWVWVIEFEKISRGEAINNA